MKTVRESYVKRLRDNYLLILRTLMHDLIVSIDTDGSFAFVNDAAVKFFGESRKKLIGSHFSDYIHPDDLKRALGALQELTEQKGQVSGFLLRAKSPQGYKTIAWNGLAIFDDAGNYMGAQATGKDLSDLLRVEEELKQSKQHFQSLFDVIVDPIVILDLTGTILEVSQSTEEIFGLSKAGLVGKSFLETKISNVDTKEVMLKNLDRLQQGKYIPPYAIESISKDGKQVFYEVNPARIKYEGEDAILAIFRNITEQKQAEKKLRASEERFRYFVENAPEAIWIQDLSGTFVDGNKLAEKITGYRRDELIGTSILDANLVPATYASAVMEAYEANLRGERSGPTELELIRKDGSTVFVEASSIPVQRDGQIEIIGIAREITDRKMAEDALRDSEKRFRDLGELLPEIVFETDLEGNLTFANQIAYEKSGYSPEDFAKGMSFINLVVPEDRSRAMNDMVKVLSGTDLGFLEYTVLRKDGSKFPMMIHTTPILRDNKLVGLRGVIIEVTEQKKSEEALKKSEERFRSTLDNMLEGCQIIGYDWKYVYLNDTAAKHGRKPKQKLLGKKILEMYPQIKGTKLLKVLTKCMKEHVPAKLENEFTFSDGKKGWFELSIEPVPEGLFILSIDITDRKEVENALHREREMLEIVTSNINAGLVVVSTDFTVLWINDVLRTYLGDIEGKPCYSTLNQNDDVCQGCGVKEIFDTGKDWVVHEQAVPTPQGDTIWLEVTATAIRNKQGEIVAASEMSLDITERKKTELELKASLQRFRTIFEGATDGITAVKPGAQNFSFVNPRMSEITGYSSEELLKLDIFDLMRQEDLSSAKELYANMLDGKLETARGMPILRKDKSLVYCDVSFKLMKISDQTYFVGFLRDVTEQKIAEDKLRESEQRFKHFLFNAPEAIWVQDISGTFIDGNKMGEELT
ncbi:MAG: hypothetical protein CW691_00185, partial [Candidatus Bathyarchaeum sp.]